MSTLPSNHELEILDRAFGGSQGAWSPDVARALLAVRLSSVDIARADELSAKAVDGSLTAVDKIEVESYRSAGRVLEILKLRARAALESQG